MAEKKQTGFIKLQIPAGAANPAPPVGPALGAQGVNIMQFCQAFNAQTQDQAGTIIPVEITVYEDKSFTFVCKTPPAAVLIKEKLGIKSGAAIPQIQVAGQRHRGGHGDRGRHRPLHGRAHRGSRDEEEVRAQPQGCRDASGQGRRLSLIQQWKGEKRPPLPRKEMQ